MGIDWLNIAEKCFEISEQKNLHVADLANLAVQNRLSAPEYDQEVLKSGFSSALSRNVSSKHPRFRKVSTGKKNAKGKTQYKRGVYSLKKIKTSLADPQLIEDQQTTNKDFIGKAGEFSVMAELLFRGFNASFMTVDDGIDVVASKDGHYFHIQVKTSTQRSNGSFQCTIRKNSFNKHDNRNTFYVLVLRYFKKHQPYLDYVILSSSQIDNFVSNGTINSNNTISFNMHFEKDKLLLGRLRTDLSFFLNRFDRIK
ncbi:MAG: hypothetical protein N4A65_06700 [Cohaesibacter sp.]|jgi:hypothetical protein|nr:hypothetical protein [Cohaesibacter sp.]